MGIECKLEDIERTLVALTEELLSLKGVVATDDFLALGGASLTAARLTLKIEDQFGVDMPQALIFDTRSLAELAEQISGLIAARRAQAESTSTG